MVGAGPAGDEDATSQ